MSSDRYGDLDDHSRFERPRRHTRPRTKDRPSYPDAVEGFILTVDRGRFTVRLTGDATFTTGATGATDASGATGATGSVDAGVPASASAGVITAMKSRPLGRKGVVVGDRVRVVGDVSGADGSLARIVEVQERVTVLRRTADDTDPVERIVVANAAQLVIVTAVADPEPRPRLIDRALVAAYDAGIRPLLCLTKVDLADPEDLLAIYRPLGVPHVVAARGTDLSALREHLADTVSAFVGSSGVGKSTLVNALVPGAGRSTGVVNAVTGRGRHTSTSAYALELPFGGWVVDTPGIRSFGLAHVEPYTLIKAFDDLNELTVDCPRGCTHTSSEPECALDEAGAAGEVEFARVESFRRLLSSRESSDGG